MSDFTIRTVEDTQADLETLNRFCHELAAYDGHESKATPDRLRNGLFKSPTTHAVLGLHAGQPVGFLLGYQSFSVYQGTRGFYVTGVYVTEEHRHRGYGRKLMAYLADYAIRNDLEFLNWMMESDNASAGAFYDRIGADRHDGWSYCRIAGDKLDRLARSAPSTSGRGLG